MDQGRNCSKDETWWEEEETEGVACSHADYILVGLSRRDHLGMQGISVLQYKQQHACGRNNNQGCVIIDWIHQEEDVAPGNSSICSHQSLATK